MNAMKPDGFKWGWEPRDLWVGLFWDVRVVMNPYTDVLAEELHVYVCPIPMLVFHWWWRGPREPLGSPVR